MILTIVDNDDIGLSESGLVNLLLDGSCTHKEKPEPDVGLALQILDFWVEEWWCFGVEIMSAELHTNFDPEDDLWYFTLELEHNSEDPVEEFVHKEFSIIEKLSKFDTSSGRLDYTVIMKNKSK